MKLNIPAGDFAGYIFDLDGTLVDTMPLHYRAWNRALQIAGLKQELSEDLFYSLGGMPTVRVAAVLAEHYGLTIDVQKVFHQKEALFLELQSEMRLIESVALLAARVHLRLDDDFPEITQALLNIVYPHYTRPIPSFSVAEFKMREGGAIAAQRIPRGTMLYSKPVEGMPVRFQTAYDTDVWPMNISEVSWSSIDRLDPPLGMFLAGQIYKFQRGAHAVFCAKLNHHNHMRCIFRCRFAELQESE